MDLKNHPGMFLNEPAAASLERLEDDHGVQPLTDAGRLESTQQEYIDRWMRGGPANRPPYLYEPKRPAKDSDHVKNGGEAVDVLNWRWWRDNAKRYGWVVDYDWDVVHFRYDRTKDQEINRPLIVVKKQIEDSNMTASVNVDGIHFFTVDNEFISHNVTKAQADITAAVNSIIDENHRLTSGQFWDLCDGLGIPRDVVDLNNGTVLNPQSGKFEKNGTWSRLREILAKIG